MGMRNKSSAHSGFNHYIGMLRRRLLKSRSDGTLARVAIVPLTLMMLLGSFASALAEYSYKKQITVHSAKVSGSGAHSQYPLLINIATDGDLSTHVTNPNGYDIIFKDSGDTQLAHEIENFNSASGNLVVWVEIPSLSTSTDTVITMYYGESSVTSPTENPAGVWDSHYKGVWHLKENPAGAAPQMLDSSAYGNHGTAQDDSWNQWSSSDRVAGKIGSGIYFHDTGGSDKHINAGNDGSLDFTTGMTLEAWVKHDSVQTINRPTIYKSDSYKMDSMRSYNITPDVYVYIQDNGWRARHPSQRLTTGWHHLVGTYDAGDRTLRIYIDGVQKASTTLSGLTNYNIRPTTSVLKLAKKDFEGIMDEPRVSDIARSPDWIQTQYNNHHSPSTFYTIGPEQANAAYHTIDAGAGLNGSIAPDGEIVVPSGANKTFAIVAESGYEVLDVEVDGASVGAVSTYTFTNVTSDHTISAAFHQIGHFKILTVSDQNGSLTPAGPVSVAPGANQSFIITPEPGYAVEDVLVDGASVGVVSTYLFPSVSADHTIEARFVATGPPPPPGSCLDMAEVPLDAQFQSAPPNIMILLDDSGSMNFEMLAPDYRDGEYNGEVDYVFDNPGGTDYDCPGCHRYDDSRRFLVRGGDRLHWKTQWKGFNKMYYDPGIDYEPWPTADGGNLGPADPDNPRAHPMHATPTFNLSGSFDTVTMGEVIVDSHDEDSFVITGPWLDLTAGEAYKGNYLVAYDEHENYTATWAPYLLGAEYKVSAWWVANEWREKDVPYSITHAGGTTEVKKDQRDNGGQWVELGTFTFDTGLALVGIDHYVDDNNNDRVCVDAIKFEPTGTVTLDIPRAHYYVKSQSENKPYLVVVDNGSIDYYAFDDADADDAVDAGELTPSYFPPADVKTWRTYADERQNFANWYSYYRRRSLTATFATAKVITAMQGVRIGLFGLNDVSGRASSIVQPVLNVKAEGEDHTDTLIDLLYSFYYDGGTPLRRALEAVGRYFDKDDDLKIDNTAGDDSPWDTADDGGECQQAFTILMTDGYWNGSNPLNTAIGNNDGDNGEPYADSYSRALADVAMYFYERDLVEDLGDAVPTNRFDDAQHQHMVTYTVGFGMTGTLSPDDYTDELKHKTTGDYIVWPNPSAGGDRSIEKIDDVWHTAVNGRGKFLNASSPTELVDALQEIMMDIELRIYSAAGVSINGDKLYQKLDPDILMFQSSYSSDGWTGDVRAYKLDPVTGEVETSSYEWSAAKLLTGVNWNTRLVASYNGTTGIPFRFNSLNSQQKSLLDTNWESDATLAQKLMAYLRGDTIQEEQNGGSLRSRFYLLGDIVHSSPVFKNDVLYAGANDGMLHAFNADSGEELFAYVPNLVFDNLKSLTSTSYAHKYFVDLTPTVSDVDLTGITTLLIGGLGRGGRGYYALNVSGISPISGSVPVTEQDVADRVLWEYPNVNTPNDQIADMGYSYSRPIIVKSYDTVNAPWIVIFGNGYNSTNGHAMLFILDPATGQLLKRIDTQVGSCNGLSSPTAVDVNYDGKVDYVYAGDLMGNLWKFDLTDSDYNNWDVAYHEAGLPRSLFQTPAQPITAKPAVMYHCSMPGYMVIFGTGKYLGDSDPADVSAQAVYGIWDYGEDVDDSEYVGAFVGGVISNTNLPDTASLLTQSVIAEQMVDGTSLRTMSAAAADWSTTTLEGADCGENEGTADCDPNDVGDEPDPLNTVGWYLPLPTSGERVTSDLLIRDGTVIIISYVPGSAQCASGGSSWLMALDACSGSRLSRSHFDVNVDNVIDDQDKIAGIPPSGIRFEGQLQTPAILMLGGGKEKLYMSSSRAKIEEMVEVAPRLGVYYWRVYRP